MFPSDVGSQNIEFLIFVQRHDFVTANQLARMRGISDRAARYYLQRLVDAEYLDKVRPEPDINKNGQLKNSIPFHYFITNETKKLILETEF